jgi:hypothetical protein
MWPVNAIPVQCSKLYFVHANFEYKFYMFIQEQVAKSAAIVPMAGMDLWPLTLQLGLDN